MSSKLADVLISKIYKQNLKRDHELCNISPLYLSNLIWDTFVVPELYGCIKKGCNVVVDFNIFIYIQRVIRKNPIFNGISVLDICKIDNVNEVGKLLADKAISEKLIVNIYKGIKISLEDLVYS